MPFDALYHSLRHPARKRLAMLTNTVSPLVDAPSSAPVLLFIHQGHLVLGHPVVVGSICGVLLEPHLGAKTTESVADTTTHHIRRLLV
jgi:hypothetical protein